MMKTFSYSASIIIILLLISGFSILSAQTYTVKGEVTTTTGPVKFARVTFIDRNDTTKRFSASTDTSGNYKLDVITAVKPRNTLPVNFELEQNYPNPFSSQTSIPYKLNKQANISVKIYNILGQLVKEFKVGIQSAGIHGVIWDGKNNFGNRVTAGIYFYRLTTGNEGLTKKMLFGFGNSPRLQQPLGTVWYQDKKNGAKKFNLVQNTEFDVRVENSGNCTPKILPKEFTNIQIEKDTALNFDVELGIMAYSLCYQKGDSATINGHYYAHWDIYLNNITGTNSKDISNWIYDDDYNPVWSPDGKYIAFRADRNGLFGTRAHLYLYDTQNDTTINLSSDTVDCDLPMWTPDSKKIVYQYHVYRPDGTQWHIINFDGTGDHKLKYKPSFFYPDSYNYIYSDDSGRVYKTNIDNSINEFVLNLRSLGGSVLYGFNSKTGEILSTADSQSAIATYNIFTKNCNTLFIGDSTFTISNLKWSRNFKKIVFIETKRGIVDSTHVEYLSILENDIKRRLVHILLNEELGGVSYFGWYYPEFSPDGKYIAYIKEFVKRGQWLTIYNDLYVVEIATGDVQHIDRGEAFGWNPLKPH